MIPKNENNGKLIGEEKVKVFFSEGFEGAVDLYVDFDIVFKRIRKEQIKRYGAIYEGSPNLAEASADVKELVCYNRDKVHEVFNGYGLAMNFEQYVLVIIGAKVCLTPRHHRLQNRDEALPKFSQWFGGKYVGYEYPILCFSIYRRGIRRWL